MYNKTDKGTLSYPKLQGLDTLSTWAYVTAEVYVYSDNEVVMDDDVRRMGSKFFVSYLDNVLTNANWRKPLSKRFISISSSFDARAATRDKVRPAEPILGRGSLRNLTISMPFLFYKAVHCVGMCYEYVARADP